MSDYMTMLIELGKNRLELETNKVSSKALQDKFNADHAVELSKIADGIAQLKVQANRCKELEDKIRALAVTEFEATPPEQQTKAMPGGVKIQDSIDVEFDESKAINWCVDNARILLSLRTNDFIRFMKDSKSPPDFVKITTKHKATIPSKIEIPEQ